MEHLTDGEIAAHLDGELAEDEIPRVEGHLRECRRCERRLEELSKLSSRLETTLERGLEPPAGLAPEPGPTEGDDARRWSLAGGLKAAAAVVALVAAGALAADAALPGTPIRDLLAEAVGGGGASGGPSAPQAVREAPPAPRAESADDSARGDRTEDVEGPARRGLGVAPVGGEVVLRVSGAPEGTPVRVQLTATGLARISARGGSFRTDPGRLELVDPTAGEVRVSVPRAATEWRLEIDTLTVLRGSGGRVNRLGEPAAEGRNTFFFRTGSRAGGAR